MTTSLTTSKHSFFERLEHKYGNPPKYASRGIPPYREQTLVIEQRTSRTILIFRAMRSFSPRTLFKDMSQDSKAASLMVLGTFCILFMVAATGAYADNLKANQLHERNVIELKVIDRYWACTQTMPQCIQSGRDIVCEKGQKQINAGIAEIPSDACIAPNSSLLSYLILSESKTNQYKRWDKIWVTATNYADHPIGSTYYACVNGKQQALAWMTQPICPPNL